MKTTDKLNVVIIVNGDNNKVSMNGSGSHFSAIKIVFILVLIVLAVLTVSLCCPDSLADFVCCIIGNAISS